MAQNIPLQYQDKEREAKAVQDMLDLAEQKAINEKNDAFKDLQDLKQNKAIIKGRYLTLIREPNGTDEKGVPKIKLVGSNMLSFKIRGNYYEYRKEIVSKK